MKSELVYQRHSGGGYIVSHRSSGTQLGIVRKDTFGRPIAVWRARPFGAETRIETFSDRASAGKWLLRAAESDGCAPGCTCAEG